MNSSTEKLEAFREAAKENGSRPSGPNMTKREEIAARILAALIGGIAADHHMTQLWGEAAAREGFASMGDYLATIAVRRADSLLLAFEKEAGHEQ